MFKNFFKLSLRSMARNKIHALINVAGLSLGIVGALVIFLIIRFELGFDVYHREADRIYRLVRTSNEFGKTMHTPGVPYPLPHALRNDFPEIEHVAIVDANFTPSVFAVTRSDGTIAKFKEEKGVAFIDPAYFKIFSQQWLAGDPERALSAPHSIVISKGIAEKFFGQEDPIGKRITYDRNHEVQVTGVVADVPPNSDLPFNLLIAYDHKERGNDNWGSVSSATQCYLKLPARLDPKQIESRLGAFLVKYQKEDEAKTVTMSLQPLRDLHFDTHFGTFGGRTVAKSTLLALGMIGVLLLITACINFVNLNTALAVRRSKEVGVRKVLGSTRPQLVLHFLAETATVMLLAIVISLALAEIVLVQLQPLLGYRLELHLFGDAAIPIFLLALLVLVTISAGFYPALHLSGFNASAALRNKLSSRYSEGLPLRKGLVLVQFAISQALIICTIVISSQIAYFQKADMGFNREAIVEVELPANEREKLVRLKNQLVQHTAIKYASFSNSGAASGNVWTSNYSLRDSSEVKEGRTHVKFIDENFIATYELKLLAGEGLAATDTLKKYIVNRTFAEETGYGDNLDGLLGKYVQIWGREAPIAGVVSDFNTSSLHQKLEPVVLSMRHNYWQAGIKIDLQNTKSALAAIEQAWSSVYPEYVFGYTFLDETIAKFYEDEQKTARLMNIFTVVAIFIGCLGLFGLVSYMTAQRTKEIGIRKVLGANLANILAMFLKEFAFLILLAFVVAAPVAYYFMQTWLADFAYRIELGGGIFLLALLAAFAIALITVGYKSLRAALANPVEALRYE
ncbi:ABC transporter permease [candidate division KSB1 bacterium]|nr:ABC transporter permease [candidate division KSB1 bacterium]